MSEYELLAAITKGLSRREAYKFIKNDEIPPYIEDKHSAKRARKIVSYYFELRPEHIVHHEDRNERNNDPRNLKVFASNKDHLRYHEKFPTKPLWDGSKVSLYKIGRF